MPFPSPQNLCDYLDLYERARLNERNSTTSYLVYGLQKGLSYITHRKPITIEIKQIVEEVKREIKKADKKFQDWWELIFFLGEKAKEVQAIKFDQSTESLLCEILHGIRSEIIQVLLSKDDDERRQFTAHVINLQNEKKAVWKEISHGFIERKGKGVKDGIIKLKKLSVQLALIENKIGILRALQLGELNDLKILVPEQDKSSCTNYANEATPYVLQEKFNKVIFEDRLQAIINISFGEFKRKQKDDSAETAKLIEISENKLAGTDSPASEISSAFDESQQEEVSHSANESEENLLIKTSQQAKNKKISVNDDLLEPSRDILYSYLDLYEITRADDRQSVSSYLQYGVEKSISLVSENVPVLEEIETIIGEVRRELNKLESEDFLDWCSLIIFLGGKAQKAQSLKYKKNDESLLCETLHGMRSYILQEFLSTQCKFHQLYKEKLTSLLKSRKEMSKDIDERFTERKGKGVIEENAKLKKMDVELAYLGDKKSLLRALLWGEFAYLKILDPRAQDKSACARFANEAAPYSFQDRFNEVIYKDQYQKILRISYETFKDEPNKRNAIIAKLREEKLNTSNEIKNSPLQEDLETALINHPKNKLSSSDEKQEKTEVSHLAQNESNDISSSCLAEETENKQETHIGEASKMGYFSNIYPNPSGPIPNIVIPNKKAY